MIAFRWIIAVLLLVCGAPVFAAEPGTPVTLVLFGDSITAPRGSLVNFAALLEKELPKQAVAPKMINAGVGGNTTEMARARFQKDVLDRKPDVVVILFGTNDSAIDVWKKPPATGSRVTRDQYEKNLGAFVRALREQKVAVVLMTPPPIRWTKPLLARYGKPPYDAKDPDGMTAPLLPYVETVRTVAKTEKVPVVDVFAAFKAHGDKAGRSLDDLFLDGMHPNDKGHRLIADQLVPVVTAELKAKRGSP